MSVRFIDNTVAVKRHLAHQATRGLDGMAANTVRVANLTAPFRNRGSLKARRTVIKKISQTVIQVIWPVAWAQYQNRGRRADGTHVVKRYTTGGTGKGFVDRGVQDTLANVRRFFS